MKFVKQYLTGMMLMAGFITNGQLINNISALNPELQHSGKPPQSGRFMSKLSITGAAGIANYFGDLRENDALWKQSSFSSALGFSYRVFPHLNARVDLSCLKVRANDGKNKRADLQARNLSFKTVIWDLSLAAEYDVFNLDHYTFTPYVFAGFGAFYFNPYAIDRYGYKEFLQPLGTEGQGLAAYPDRRMYKRVECEVPFGGGVKWAVNKRLTFQLEFKYRHTNTDYIDDVSRLGYPDKTLLDARNPRTAKLTYRGDELPGGAPYPTGTGLNRGNPKGVQNNDAFYTTQFKFIYRLTK
jgi:hypothetical protein